MRILVAVDQNPETGFVVRQVAELAKNTWANVTLMGISVSEAGVNELAGQLVTYREMFFPRIEEDVLLYGQLNAEYELVHQKKGSGICGLREPAARRI